MAGLLAVGAVAHGKGLFDAFGHRLGGLGRIPVGVLCSALAVVAVTSAVLNLDTTAAFVTAVVILAARRRRLQEDAFLYGTLFMTNAASLLLPGSNLTNLLVLGQEHVSGAHFAARMAPAWVAAVVVTGAVVAFRWRGSLRAHEAALEIEPAPPISLPAVLLVGVTAVLIVAVGSPAIPVFGVAAVGSAIAVVGGRVDARCVAEAVDPAALVGLFGVAVALGALARSWDGPSQLLESAGRPATIAVAAATVVLNNLPAAALLSARTAEHPRGLLLGLNLGPNLAVTGSLSAFVWTKAARAVDARPNWRRVSAVGVVFVHVTLAAAAAATHFLAPSGW